VDERRRDAERVGRGDARDERRHLVVMHCRRRARRGCTKHERHDHETGAVRGCHEKRPTGELPRANAHSAERHVAMAHETVDAHAGKCRCNAPPQPAQRQYLTQANHDQHGGRDRQRMSDGEWTERAPHRAPVPLLESPRDREQPTHSGIDTMHRAEGEQREPRQRTLVHHHSA